jgi:hypothetical protein
MIFSNRINREHLCRLRVFQKLLDIFYRSSRPFLQGAPDQFLEWSHDNIQFFNLNRERQSAHVGPKRDYFIGGCEWFVDSGDRKFLIRDEF